MLRFKYPTALTFELPVFEADSCELIIPSAVDVLKVDYETFEWDLIDEFKIKVDLPDAGAGLRQRGCRDTGGLENQLLHQLPSAAHLWTLRPRYFCGGFRVLLHVQERQYL